MLSQTQPKGCSCGQPFRWRDRSGPETPFAKSRSIERRYAAQLKQVAREIGRIAEGFVYVDPFTLKPMQDAMARYAELLRPWAHSVAGRIVAELDHQDETAWLKHAQRMSRALRQELENAPTGATTKAFLSEQVRLITSLPIEAGERVHKLTLEGMHNATRASEIAAEIARTGEVTISRATLIARTEVSRTASALTMARAVHIGSDGYLWRTAKDTDVRKSHSRMEGRFVRWDTAPTLSDGTTTHAGMIYNCRCYPEPVIPEVV